MKKVKIAGKSKKFTSDDKLDLSCRSTEIACGRLHGKLKSNRLRQKMKKKKQQKVCASHQSFLRSNTTSNHRLTSDHSQQLLSKPNAVSPIITLNPHKLAFQPFQGITTRTYYYHRISLWISQHLYEHYQHSQTSTSYRQGRTQAASLKAARNTHTSSWRTKIGEIYLEF